MSNNRVIPICFSKDLLNKIDVEVLKVGSVRTKGRAFNRSEFICTALKHYLETVCYKKINYFKVAEKKLEKALGRG